MQHRESQRRDSKHEVACPSFLAWKGTVNLQMLVVSRSREGHLAEIQQVHFRPMTAGK